MAKKPTQASAQQLLGAQVQDKITNFKGVATSIVYMLSGSVQLSVDSGVDKDGKMRDSFFFDVDRLKYLKVGPMTPTVPDDTVHIQLGQTAKDRITGVEGTITEKVIHINGCTTVVLTQKTPKKDERLIVVDWKRLDLGGSKMVLPDPMLAVKPNEPSKGGPMRKVSRERV